MGHNFNPREERAVRDIYWMKNREATLGGGAWPMRINGIHSLLAEGKFGKFGKFQV